MPVVIPEDLAAVGPNDDKRMAWFATVHQSVLYKGPPTMPVESYTIHDCTTNVRLFLYCGTITDEDFAAHVCVLMRGELSTLPGALRAAASNMRLEEADGLGIPLGMGCWNPACSRIAPVVLPKAHPDRWWSELRRGGRFNNCKECRFAHYCSRDCQKADWPRHRGICASVGRAYTVDRRRDTHEEQKVHTSFGFGTVYDFCLWAHLIGRLQRVLLRAHNSREGGEGREEMEIQVGHE